MTGSTGHAPRLRRRVTVRGVVQGVGFRPHVYVLARSLDLAGAVWNTADGVVAEVEGRDADVAAFCDRVGPEAPVLALVAGVAVEELPAAGGTSFTIRRSEHGPGRTFVSPDVTICDDCLADLTDPANRRFRHPFVTCTNCGPRFTLTTGLPYDRPTTTMAGFAMCEACAAEYADPADRRFHAQTVCCPGCGPRLSLARPGRDTTYDEAALGGGPAPRRRRRGGRRQGDRRLPPRVRRHQRAGRRHAAQAQAARRQAVRAHGPRPWRRPGTWSTSTTRRSACCRARPGRSSSPPAGPTPAWPTRSPRAAPTSG